MNLSKLFGKNTIAATLAAAIAAATPGAAFARGNGGDSGGSGGSSGGNAPSCCGSTSGSNSTTSGSGHETKADQDLCFAIPQPQQDGTVSFATFRAPRGLLDSARAIPNTVGKVAFDGNGYREFLQARSTPKTSGFLGMGGDKTPIINVMWDKIETPDATFVPQCDEKLKGLISEFGGYTLEAPAVVPSTTRTPEKKPAAKADKPLVYFKGEVQGKATGKLVPVMKP